MVVVLAIDLAPGWIERLRATFADRAVVLPASGAAAVELARTTPITIVVASFEAVTMGVGTILEAKKLLLVATGDEKASIVAKTIEGPITSMISATSLQLHENAIVILDEAAAAKLEFKDSYKWSFEHDPKWAKYQNI